MILKLTRPDAPLDLTSAIVQRYLGLLVEYLDGFEEELGGRRAADGDGWVARDRHLALWATELYGAVTADRYTLVDDEDPR